MLQQYFVAGGVCPSFKEWLVFVAARGNVVEQVRSIVLLGPPSHAIYEWEGRHGNRGVPRNRTSAAISGESGGLGEPVVGFYLLFIERNVVVRRHYVILLGCFTVKPPSLESLYFMDYEIAFRAVTINSAPLL